MWMQDSYKQVKFKVMRSFCKDEVFDFFRNPLTHNLLL
jgi:hypothetical protein